jgi:DNA repair protein RadC
MSNKHEKGKKKTGQDSEKPTMPREKLISDGVDTLSISELIAIVFGTGSRREPVLVLSDRLLKEYGSSGLKDIRDVKTLQAATGLPPVKACQMVACFELGRRMYAKQPRGAQSRAIRSPQDVFDHLVEMRGLRKEQLRGLYLNARNKIIHEETVSIGTITANLVHPAEVFRPAIEYSAVGLIIAHNHPSGDPEPSDEDIAITSQLVQAASILGIKLLDHIIVAEQSFRSMSELGIM